MFPNGQHTLTNHNFPISLTRTITLTMLTRLVGFRPLTTSLPLARARLTRPIIRHRRFTTVRTHRVQMSPNTITRTRRTFIKPRTRQTQRISFTLFRARVTATRQTRAVTTRATLTKLRFGYRQRIFRTRTVKSIVRSFCPRHINGVIFSFRLRLTPATRYRTAKRLPFRTQHKRTFRASYIGPTRRRRHRRRHPASHERVI